MKIEELIDRGDETGQRIRETLNVLLESPYFYKTDDERLFLVLTRYKRAFESFFDKFFGWTLVMDAKCARLYKPKWFNEKITLPNRDMFGFTKRDECMAFLLLIEFFDFRFGDWLEYAAARFRALMPDKEENYTDERVRQILRDIMPDLVRYRFLQKVRPSADDSVSEAETIFECLPALWHYQAAQLNQPIAVEEESAS